ncbi:MAG: MFS transporter small subunit, partial [Pseudonocardia sp.]
MSAEPAATGRTSGSPVIAWLAWIWVVVPFLYGLYKLAERIPALFG